MRANVERSTSIVAGAERKWFGERLVGGGLQVDEDGPDVARIVQAAAPTRPFGT